MCFVKGYYLGRVEVDQSRNPNLPGRISNHLCEYRGRNEDSVLVFQSACKEQENIAIISIQSDKPSSIKNNSAHAVFRTLDRLGGVSMRLAHARSLGVTGPPVA